MNKMDKENLDRLRELICGNMSGGMMDIVWGEDLHFIETQSNTAVIFGVGGQDGTYLSKLLLSKGYQVIGVVRRSSQSRPYLSPLIEKGLVIVEGDVMDYSSIQQIIKEYRPIQVYNLAAQSHVGTSFKQPLYTWDVTAKGVLNILEIIRTVSPKTRFYQASSSEMFGKSVTTGHKLKDGVKLSYCGTCGPNKSYEEIFDVIKFQDEDTQFIPQSPYAIAKLAAHEAVRLYRESYGLFACAGILFNHESEMRGEQFVTRKITRYIGRLQSAINSITHGADLWVKETFPKLKLGNLDACRDWSHAEDLVRAMVMMLEDETPNDYVIGSGETHSVREFVELAFKEVGLNWEDWVEIDQSLIRPAEVDYLCAKPTKAQEQLGWIPMLTFNDLVKRMVNNDIELSKKESV